MAGPLAGFRIIEVSGIGPGPFGAMMLSDMGAEVIRVERPSATMWEDPSMDLLNRGRRCITIDLKQPLGVETLLRLLDSYDALLEGFRPGVMERLGLGPEVCLERNPALVYGRMTGWGQTGPLANAAGHDINYIALAGALHPIGRRGEPPTVPLNLVGDFGGGGLMLAYGVVCALLERSRSGKGQVVDAAMVDGAATLMTIFHATQQLGYWSDERGTNLLDGGSHFYDTYETQDGKWISIGSFEPKFYALLLEKLDLDPATFPQMDKQQWPAQKQKVAALFLERTRDEWCKLLEGTDVCFAPVLTIAEAREHPHNTARGTFTQINGVSQPRPTPRFGRTDSEISRPPAHPGEHTEEILTEAGWSPEEIAGLRDQGAIK
ncbi:MAG: CoA transferase [Deltaproteobacteria bacterium]|nr:CoA transferase [Deltaproteobacteria bacterium]MBW2389471.1 CoA transferase [Deltaproteobacteria bacterium]MBW2726334.1 CoA transferase [Deltaproteobacteria bacterium]